MNNEELLKLAAKSIDLNGNYFKDEVDNEEECYISEGIYCVDENDCGYTWNPLTDDGDALRLAIKLHIDISSYKESGNVYANSKHSLGIDSYGYHSYQDHRLITEPLGEDPMASTRRAIVRAAAEIGKNI